MSAHFPKAFLYYNPLSIWSSAALLALGEKGYGEDELELKIVDIGKAENLSATFLRINPKGTIPTLVVPLEKTLAPEDDHRYKALTDTKAVLEFLDKSRSVISRTHTISAAPAPSLTPATIALSSTSSNIIALLHSDDADPNALLYYNATSSAELHLSAGALVPLLIGRQTALTSYLTASDKAEVQASEKTRNLWETKLTHIQNLLSVYSTADKDESQLTDDEKAIRDIYFTIVHEKWTQKLRKALLLLEKEMIGPFTLGDQISIADLHLGPWLARIAFLSGGLSSDSGETIVAKIEQRIGNGFVLPKDFRSIAASTAAVAASQGGGGAGAVDPVLQVTLGAKRTKLAAFWDEIRARPSWKKLYGEKLH